MKTIKRRAFCKAAAAAVAGVLAPHAAAEALLPQAVVGSAVPEDYYSFAFRSDHSETAVSYTHLDVYKRQALPCSAWAA